jgi:hypothetical protein
VAVCVCVDVTASAVIVRGVVVVTLAGVTVAVAELRLFEYE